MSYFSFGFLDLDLIWFWSGEASFRVRLLFHLAFRPPFALFWGCLRGGETGGELGMMADGGWVRDEESEGVDGSCVL